MACLSKLRTKRNKNSCHGRSATTLRVHGTGKASTMENSTTIESAVQGAALKPDMDQAKRYLAALDPDPNAIFAFQTFDDSKTKDRKLAVTRSGKFLELAALLVQFNRRRIGVFVTVNKTDGGGREAIVLPLKTFPLVPSVQE